MKKIKNKLVYTVWICWQKFWFQRRHLLLQQIITTHCKVLQLTFGILISFSYASLIPDVNMALKCWLLAAKMTLCACIVRPSTINLTSLISSVLTTWCKSETKVDWLIPLCVVNMDVFARLKKWLVWVF